MGSKPWLHYFIVLKCAGLAGFSGWIELVVVFSVTDKEAWGLWKKWMLPDGCIPRIICLAAAGTAACDCLGAVVPTAAKQTFFPNYYPA